MEIYIQPSKLEGTLSIPPSKSHTQRALLFALMGKGVSKVDNVLDSPDIDAMCWAIEAFGAKIQRQKNTLEISGKLNPPADVIDAGNSGQVLRFIGAIAALLPSYCTIDGDHSIRTSRPIKPLLHALRELGAIAESLFGNGYAPIQVRGPIHPGTCHLPGEDSQPVSALIIAASFLDGPSEIIVKNPGETPWIDMTLHWLRRLGAEVEHANYSHYKVKGGLKYSGFTETIPGDFSTAAFPIVAALITNSTLTLEGLDPNDVQGDKYLIDICKQMGANIHWENQTLVIEPSPNLTGIDIDINLIIDALPILAVLGCSAEGTTRLYNGQIARHKESDRIFAMCTELKKMGADIEETRDGLIINKSALKGAELNSHKDHRVALALSVAALGANSPSIMKDTECIKKTYPHFVENFQKIGANLELNLVRI